MKIFNKIIFKIKVFIWKRKLNKVYGYKYGKLTRSYDMSSFYPGIILKNSVYEDTDSVKKKN